MTLSEQCAGGSKIIETKNLSIRYGQKIAVENINMCICEKNITAFIGPSGCGKTSVLHSLNRMSDLILGCEISGQILLDGECIHSAPMDAQRLRQKVGLIFQKPNPFPFSIIENLTLALKEMRGSSPAQREQKAEQSLRQVGLWQEVKDRLKQPANSLSGGQQQRLCIARALILDPEVLLMDEPCSALDPLASGRVEDLIVELKGKLSLLVVTHNLAQAKRIADDVLFFWAEDGPGQLIESDSAEHFFSQPKHTLSKAYLSGARG